MNEQMSEWDQFMSFWKAQDYEEERHDLVFRDWLAQRDEKRDRERDAVIVATVTSHVPILSRDANGGFVFCVCGWNKDGTEWGAPPEWLEHVESASRSICPDASRLLEVVKLKARLEERQSVAEYLEHAYSKDVFRPLAQEEINCLAGVMGDAIDGGSDRMHAEWARHWARCFRMDAADLKRQIEELGGEA